MSSVIDALGPYSGYQANTSEASDTMDQQAFLSMFIEQLKSQDPTDPQDSTQMASQLAQFSTLEEMSSVNTNLGSMMTLQTVNNNTAMMTFLGKDVVMQSSGVEKLDGEFLHRIKFDVDGDPKSLTLTVQKDGVDVKEIELPVNDQGEINLNDLDELADFADGAYSFEMSAVGHDDSELTVNSYTVAKIDSMFFDSNGPNLKIGSYIVDASKIVEVQL